MNRSGTYQFTVYRDVIGKIPQGQIDELRKEIKILNLKNRILKLENPNARVPRLRVRVRGRLGKNSPYSPLYRRGGKLHRYTSQDIRIEHSERVDVYVLNQ